MLVASSRLVTPGLRWRRWACLSLVVLVLTGLSLAPHLTESTELVRLRNALLLVDEKGHGFDWTPATMPQDFMLERGAANPYFVEAAERLGLSDMPSDWDKVSAISRHILSHPHLVGTPIQSDLQNTYQQIIGAGTGYCGDFTRVFMAFALTVGIPVRAWAFSFDGFGGHGHVWPEIWNRQLQRWQLVDIFNNYYFHGEDGIPISAIEFRHAMLFAPQSIESARLSPGARAGYANEEKMWAWYRQGLPEWYMVWGNNVFSYDRALIGSPFAHISRSMEQLEAIALGVYPHVSLMVTPGNHEQARMLWLIRFHLLAAMWVGVFAMLTLLWTLFLGFRAWIEHEQPS